MARELSPGAFAAGGHDHAVSSHPARHLEAVVRNHWWNGFGIRMRSGFRLYNVSGLDAVELQLKSGEIRRIGTDDPQALVEALKATGLRG
jgi:hypothetical protein